MARSSLVHISTVVITRYHHQEPMPNWVTWSNFVNLLLIVPGWIAFLITVRKAWLERTLLEFTLQATSVEADEDDERTDRYVDDVAVVPALRIGVTNNGSRPITTLQYECVFTFQSKGQKRGQSKSTAPAGMKIGQGDHCCGLLRVFSTTIEIVSACVVDTTGKRWSVPSRKLRKFNARDVKQLYWK